jgi:carboxymethylenebutenolidase
VLVLYGGEDAGIPPEARDAFDRALDAAGAEHRSIVYEGAPHSFFDRKSAEFADASADAWRQMLDFVGAG